MQVVSNNFTKAFKTGIICNYQKKPFSSFSLGLIFLEKLKLTFNISLSIISSAYLLSTNHELRFLLWPSNSCSNEQSLLKQGGHSFLKNNFQDISRTFQAIWDIFPGHFLLEQV